MYIEQKPLLVRYQVLYLASFMLIHSVASAELRIQSVYPTVGKMGEDLEVVLTGTGFDEDTRVSMYLDTGNRKAIAGSVDTVGEAWGLAMADGKAYVADGRGGLQVVDISNPESPIIIGSVDALFDARGVAIADDKAYVTDGHRGLVIVPLPVEISPTIVSGQARMHLTLPSPQVAGNYTIRAFNNTESSEFVGAIAFTSEEGAALGKPGDSTDGCFVSAIGPRSNS